MDTKKKDMNERAAQKKNPGLMGHAGMRPVSVPEQSRPADFGTGQKIAGAAQ